MAHKIVKNSYSTSLGFDTKFMNIYEILETLPKDTYTSTPDPGACKAGVPGPTYPLTQVTPGKLSLRNQLGSAYPG